MPSKRPHDESSTPTGDSDGRAKKPKTGFRVGPANLPDGAWKRKVAKIKTNLIVKAKVKKQYAKVKAEFAQQHPEPAAIPIPADELEPTTTTTNAHDATPREPTPPAQIHPSRQAMLDEPATTQPPASDQNDTQPQPRNNRDRKQRARHNKPDYFANQLAAAEQAKAAEEAHVAEWARRTAERDSRIADREKYRKAMAKAKTPGRDGKRKLGRESGLLLDKVKRIVRET